MASLDPFMFFKMHKMMQTLKVFFKKKKKTGKILVQPVLHGFYFYSLSTGPL